MFYFQLDALSTVLLTLIVALGVPLFVFSTRYMRGFANQHKFLREYVLLMGCIILVILSNHVGILLCFLGLSYGLLARLMGLNQPWQQGKNSAKLALNSLLGSVLCLSFGLGLLVYEADSWLMSVIIETPFNPAVLAGGCALITAGVFLQTGLWPFHRWLTSSLNAPTPVSALMHAGLINLGGYLLTRLSPLFSQLPWLMEIIFVIGLISALLGTLWKLVQPNVKRMLACSTMSQMGFMIAQCGLGLYACAVIHLCWHGLFKAYLFLSSGSAHTDHKTKTPPPNLTQLVGAVSLGALACTLFGLTSAHELVLDTSLFLYFVAWLGTTQVALTCLQRSGWLSALLASVFMACLYGLSVRLMLNGFGLDTFMAPGPIHGVHGLGMMALCLSWLAMLYGPALRPISPKWFDRGYVASLNASQPHPNTISSLRSFHSKGSYD